MAVALLDACCEASILGLEPLHGRVAMGRCDSRPPVAPALTFYKHSDEHWSDEAMSSTGEATHFDA